HAGGCEAWHAVGFVEEELAVAVQEEIHPGEPSQVEQFEDLHAEPSDLRFGGCRDLCGYLQLGKAVRVLRLIVVQLGVKHDLTYGTGERFIIAEDRYLQLARVSDALLNDDSTVVREGVLDCCTYGLF